MVDAPLICIVDDAADYRFLLQTLFKRDFPMYSARFFPSGKTLLAELPQMSQKPNLILLDRHMPELDGHQTLLRLKQDKAYKTIPVVMMSADASASEIQKCYEACANSFLRKQIDFASLRTMIATICHYWLEINQEPVDTL